MSEHLTHFTTLRERYHAFYRALFLLSREEEIGSAPEAYMQRARAATAEKLAALRETLESIKREYGLLETGESER